MLQPHGTLRLVTLAVLTFLLPGLAAAQSPGHAYVTIPDNNAVAVVDTSTNTTVNTIQIPTGTYPNAVAITADAQFAYIVNSGSFQSCDQQTVSVLDITPNSPTYDTVVATINVGMGISPGSVAVSADGTRAYVSNFCDNTVSVIDTASHTVLSTIAVNAGPENLVLNPHDGFVYVAEGTNLDLLNPATGIVTSEGSLFPNVFSSPGVDALAVSPDGQRLYATSLNYGNFYVFNLPLSSTSAVYTGPSTFCVPGPPVISPDGATLYVVDLECASLTVVDTGTFSINFVTAAPPDPLEPRNTMSVAITDDSSNAYIGGSYFMGKTGQNINGLLAINTSTLAIPAGVTVPTSALPSGMAFAPSNTSVGSSIAVLPTDLATGTDPVAVTFSNITQAGYTDLVISLTGPAPSSGLTLGSPAVYYNLTTSGQYPANVAGSITVCINYSGISFSGGTPGLFHYENGAWTNVSTSVDSGTDTVCGAVSSLSSFAIFGTPVVNYTIGGSVSGLSSGASVTLLDNGADSLTVTGNGAFTFATSLIGGASYNVTIGTQASGETCTVNGGSGAVGMANVTSVSVSCAPNTYSIGGSVSGLSSGASVTLLDNGADSLTVSSNGAFTFANRLIGGASYKATIGTQPTNQTCTVAGGSGTVASANVTSVAVTCTANTHTTGHSIGGEVYGLRRGASVTLLDNGTDSLTITADGWFTFLTRLAPGTGYDVTVARQPADESCRIVGAEGKVGSWNVTNVHVDCWPTSFTVRGTTVGLISGASLTLLNNGTDSLKITANGAFTFPTRVAVGTFYHVTLATQPADETCKVIEPEGRVSPWDVPDVVVVCKRMPSFTIGGTVSGLNRGAAVNLLNNGGDLLEIAANGRFTFDKALPAGTAYDVTVGKQPSHQTCTVIKGSGKLPSANLTGVSVFCK